MTVPNNLFVNYDTDQFEDPYNGFTVHDDGTDTYSIQGGPEYPSIGTNSWTNVTPGTTSSPTNTLHPAISAFDGSGYISDVRVY